MEDDVIRSLMVAVQIRDNGTGMHIVRMSEYAHLLAKTCGLSDEDADFVLRASPLHDTGKIGISDDILLKRGELTFEERKVMCRHPIIGAEILRHGRSPLFRMAHDIALQHHEKWNGGGYPRGLAGEDISIAARIVTVADVFDALTTERPYKEVWGFEDAMRFIKSERGLYFDPYLVDCFVELEQDIIKIKNKYSEEANQILQT